MYDKLYTTLFDADPSTLEYVTLYPKLHGVMVIIINIHVRIKTTCTYKCTWVMLIKNYVCAYNYNVSYCGAKSCSTARMSLYSSS